MRKAEFPKTLNETGALSLYVAVVFAVFMLMTGLVADGAEIRHARRRLDDLAARIAREAAQQVDTAELHRGGKTVLNITRAKSAGTSLIISLGLTGEVNADKDRVTVTLRETVKPALSVIPSSQVIARREAVAASTSTS